MAQSFPFGHGLRTTTTYLSVTKCFSGPTSNSHAIATVLEVDHKSAIWETPNLGTGTETLPSVEK